MRILVYVTLAWFQLVEYNSLSGVDTFLIFTTPQQAALYQLKYAAMK